MKNKLVYNRSSNLMVWPVIIVMMAGCIVSFIFKAYYLSLVLLIVFLVMLAARLWAQSSAKKLDLKIRVSETGAFPGEKIVFNIEITNNKFIPVICASLYFPLSKRLCLLPENIRNTEDNEKTVLADGRYSEEKVGEKNIPALLWYESQSLKTVWSAKKRGIYSNEGWTLRSGDGFGLSQMETAISKDDIKEIAVYPKKILVNTDIFMRNAWNANTGARGVMEDNTVIRSTREYVAGDSAKNINWRLYARGLPLSVNVYEEILPQSIFFIFDGESFHGADKHIDEMEDALSIIASVVVELDGKVQAGICFSKDAARRVMHLETGTETEEILRAFAAYEPQDDVTDDNNNVVDIISEFNSSMILDEEQRAGRFYYVTYDAKNRANDELLSVLDAGKTTILSYTDEKKDPFEVLDIKKIKL